MLLVQLVNSLIYTDIMATTCPLAHQQALEEFTDIVELSSNARISLRKPYCLTQAKDRRDLTVAARQCVEKHMEAEILERARLLEASGRLRKYQVLDTRMTRTGRSHTGIKWTQYVSEPRLPDWILDRIVPEDLTFRTVLVYEVRDKKRIDFSGWPRRPSRG